MVHAVFGLCKYAYIIHTNNLPEPHSRAVVESMLNTMNRRRVTFFEEKFAGEVTFPKEKLTSGVPGSQGFLENLIRGVTFLKKSQPSR